MGGREMEIALSSAAAPRALARSPNPHLPSAHLEAAQPAKMATLRAAQTARMAKPAGRCSRLRWGPLIRDRDAPPRPPRPRCTRRGRRVRAKGAGRPPMGSRGALTHRVPPPLLLHSRARALRPPLQEDCRRGQGQQGRPGRRRCRRGHLHDRRGESRASGGPDLGLPAGTTRPGSATAIAACAQGAVRPPAAREAHSPRGAP